MLALLLAAATGTPATAPAPAAAPPSNILLHPPIDGCGRRESSDEVVVCADRDADKRYRLKPIDPQLYADPPIRAETNFAGGVLGLAGQQKSVGGFPSNRIMFSYKIKF